MCLQPHECQVSGGFRQWIKSTAVGSRCNFPTKYSYIYNYICIFVGPFILYDIRLLDMIDIDMKYT